MTAKQLEFLLDAALRLVSALAMELGIEPGQLAERYSNTETAAFFETVLCTAAEKRGWQPPGKPAEPPNRK